jgi:hypothetical protein
MKMRGSSFGLAAPDFGFVAVRLAMIRNQIQIDRDPLTAKRESARFHFFAVPRWRFGLIWVVRFVFR